MIREEMVIFCLLFEGGTDDSSVYALLVLDCGILTKGKKVQKKQVNDDDSYVITQQYGVYLFL